MNDCEKCAKLEAALELASDAAEHYRDCIPGLEPGIVAYGSPIDVVRQNRADLLGVSK